MSVPLASPPFPVTLTPGFTTEQPKVLEVLCRDRLWQDISVFDATDRQEVFRVAGTGILKTWSLRRGLQDASGQHLLDFRHYSLDIKNRWIIEDPAGKKLANIEHVHQLTRSHSAVDATVFGARKGEDVVVEMRPLDRSAAVSTVAIKGAIIAEILQMADNDIIFNRARGKDRTAWKVSVAGGVDLVLVMIMVLCRVEMAHVWKQ